MKCQLIQTAKIADSNRAEQETLAFLSNLPEGYFVYRELQLTPAFKDRLRGMDKKQPDFVVVSQEIGLVSLEVKDWDLVSNSYEWVDQYKVRVTRRNADVDEIGNPTAQADAYLNAFVELLKGYGAFVTSALVFPRISRANFLNGLGNPAVLGTPQGRFYVDLQRTLFKEDLDAAAARPEAPLIDLVRRDGRFHPSTESQVERVNETLLPRSFKIGDFTRRQQNQQHLRIVSERQQRWIFGLDDSRNYLLDVAGSGKTNALVSRAIHVVDQAKGRALPRVLLTTYNHNLETNIRRILEHKIGDCPGSARYRDAIQVRCVPGLMEMIVAEVLGPADFEQYRVAGGTPSEYEAMLRRDVRSALASEPDRFRAFDHMFIDEIQDFDDFYLLVLKHLNRTDSYFFVGDIGQKIYERSHNLARLGFVTERVQLDKSYQMYRTPQFIAELAVRFILSDAGLRSEFEEQGYVQPHKYPNKVNNVAEIMRSARPETDAAERVRRLLAASCTEDDIMVITSESRLASAATALASAGIRYALGEPESGGVVTLVDFMNVKGLEREVVLVTGIEDLYDRTKPEGTFADEDTRFRREQLSRRKVYVSLTRTLEQVVVFYSDPGNRFVGELVRLNADILARRQQVAHGI